VIWFSKDSIALNTMDFWVGTFCIFVLATVQIICFGWIWGIKNGAAELDQGSLIKIPRLFLFVMKWVAPVHLLVVLGGFTYFDLRAKVKNMANDPVALATVVVKGAVLALPITLLAMGRVSLARSGSRHRWPLARSQLLTNEPRGLDIYGVIARPGLGCDDLGLLSSPQSAA
jgi:hypothetical protein